MKEVSWLNMINAVFMYAALIIALIAMFVYLPGNGWEDVAQNITDSGNAWMLDIFGNKNLIIGFAIPTIFLYIHVPGRIPDGITDLYRCKRC